MPDEVEESVTVESVKVDISELVSDFANDRTPGESFPEYCKRNNIDFVKNNPS